MPLCLIRLSFHLRLCASVPVIRLSFLLRVCVSVPLCLGASVPRCLCLTRLSLHLRHCSSGLTTPHTPLLFYSCICPITRLCSPTAVYVPFAFWAQNLPSCSSAAQNIPRLPQGVASVQSYAQAQNIPSCSATAPLLFLSLSLCLSCSIRCTRPSPFLSLCLCASVILSLPDVRLSAQAPLCSPLWCR